MANFCIATKMAPSEYRKLTLAEYGAFIDVLNERGKANPLEELM